MTEANQPRAVAAGVLAALLQRGGSLSRLLPEATAALAPRDSALVSELCYGVCRFYPRLRGLITPLLKKPLKNKDRDIECLLLLGCYQLDYLRIPDHAAISETVAAARLLNKPWATGLINGVLRQYQRRKESLEAGLDEADRLCHPVWLLQKLQQQWPRHWRTIVEANNNPAPMTLRVNRLRVQRDEYLQQLWQAGIAAEACRISPAGITLAKPCDVSALPDFTQGACSVQDEASQLVAPLLQPDQQQHILDSCCAPGGKTGHLLELSGPDTQLDAVEIDSQRLDRVRENLERLGLTARLQLGDARQPDQWWNRRAYDAILLDAPCSASGVIRRHPDIKVLRQAGDLAKLNTLQSELLAALWPCLRPGGRLVFTTCSVLEEENDQTIAGFLQQTGDAVHQAIEVSWGEPTRYGRQLLPQKDASDGFYYACLYKKKATAASTPNDK